MRQTCASKSAFVLIVCSQLNRYSALIPYHSSIVTGFAVRCLLPYDSFMNSYTDPAIRITLLPRDTNSAGTIFGGVILSYIDMAGAIEAHRRTRMDRFVTVAMREVIFHKPVFVGDLVSFYAETVRIGNTSITIRVIVEAERVAGSSERVRVTEAEVVYVAVDANRQKVKITAP